MKARAPIWRKLVEEHLAKGMSHREVAEALALPVGTVKTWKHRQKKAAMKPAVKPGCAKEKPGAMKPAVKPGKVEVHRGLTVDMMPGRTGWERRINWSLFTRGEWPPKEWRIPASLEGSKLVEALVERAAKSKPRGSR